jgi:hypothetical protein
VELIGHTGFVGASAFHAPEQDATLIGTINHRLTAGLWSAHSAESSAEPVDSLGCDVFPGTPGLNPGHWRARVASILDLLGAALSLLEPADSVT